VQQVKTKDIAVIGLAIILVLFLWYRFVYSSMDSQASKATQAAQDAKTQADSLQHQLNELTGTSQKKKASNDELQKAIPPTPDVGAFLRQVQQVRDSVGIPDAFQTIVPTAPTAQSGGGTVGMGITVKGSYSQMMDYVNRLNKLSRLVVIDNVQITASTAGGTSSGGPTGEVFAGQGAPPELSMQISARLFTSAAPPVSTTGSAAPVVAAPPAS
jgi:Tfp pilus assembly protein PilO